MLIFFSRLLTLLLFFVVIWPLGHDSSLLENLAPGSLSLFPVLTLSQLLGISICTRMILVPDALMPSDPVFTLSQATHFHSPTETLTFPVTAFPPFSWWQAACSLAKHLSAHSLQWPDFSNSSALTELVIHWPAEFYIPHPSCPYLLSYLAYNPLSIITVTSQYV